MGKIEVRGNATRTVECDTMKLKICFNSEMNTPDVASKKAMDGCEAFLSELKSIGVDISKIALTEDSVKKSACYSRSEEYEVKYIADREIEITAAFDMTLLNTIRSIANEAKSHIGFNSRFFISNEAEICQELLTEALKDAKQRAEIMAKAIDQKVVDLVSADKNDPRANSDHSASVLCAFASGDINAVEYTSTNEIGPTTKTLSETIFTVWEVA